MLDNARKKLYSLRFNSINGMEKHMKRMRYEPQVKASIIAAVQEARKGGKTWVDALAAAQAAGYKGTVGGLTQFVAASSPTKKTAKVKKAKAKPKPAVPAPAVNAPVAKAPTAKPTSGPLDITALVHKTVTDAVVNALEALLVSIKGGH